MPKKTTPTRRKSSGVDKPKRACNAFCFYMRDMAHTVAARGGQDKMKALQDQWKTLSAQQREPYEQAAAKDTERYRREKERAESNRVKRPANAYIQFVQNFMAQNAANYDGVTRVVAAEADEWKHMTDADKAPWQKRAVTSIKQYKDQMKDKPKPKPATKAQSKLKPKPKPKAKTVPKTKAKPTAANKRKTVAKKKVVRGTGSGARKPAKSTRKVPKVTTTKTQSKGKRTLTVRVYTYAEM